MLSSLNIGNLLLSKEKATLLRNWESVITHFRKMLIDPEAISTMLLQQQVEKSCTVEKYLCDICLSLLSLPHLRQFKS